MEKRGYKLQEFVAHSANVNCIKFGKKTHRIFITGGDDEKVNLWSIGKPTSITSLSGHTSPIESVAFDSTEVLVAAGATSGVIKLWDLEETKLVRTLNGHRSYCTAVEFHPFGEFFASGSMDTNLKIWDIRKKGCLHTYKGHRRAVSTIRFSPDGRWVVSGGLDNVVKIWDLTAGKLLHEFKLHEGHIRSIDFHPLEFLLATGSSDRTVKFWDLETFELIGSTRPEATGVRSVTFHPDGRTLLCGFDNSLKVYSWEPVICHDAVEMGWSTLGDLCVDDGKLLGCSYYQNSVGVWVADVSHIELQKPSTMAEVHTLSQPKTSFQESLIDSVGSPRRSSISPDDDTKDIKNIYVDCMTPVVSRKASSLPTVVNLDNPEEIDDLATHKQVPAAKITEKANDNSSVPAVEPCGNSEAKDSAKSRRESIVSGQGSTGVSLKPPHRRRPSTTKLDIEGVSITVESVVKNGPDTATSTNFRRRLLADDAAKDSSEEKAPTSMCVAKEFQKASSPRPRPQENGDASVDSNKGLQSVKYVNGVAVVRGRTRSLVERFEKREKLDTDECQTPNTDMPEAKTAPVRAMTPDVVPCEESESKMSQIPEKTPDMVPCAEPEAKRPLTPKKTSNLMSCPVSEAITLTMPLRRPDRIFKAPTEANTSLMRIETPDVVPCEEPEAKTPQMPVKTPDLVSYAKHETKTPTTPVKTPDVTCPISDAKTSNIPVRRSDLVSKAPTVAKTSLMRIKTPDLLPCEEPEAKRPQMQVKTPDVVSCAESEAKTFTVPVRRPDMISRAPTEARTSPALAPASDSNPNVRSEDANSCPASVVQRPKTAPSLLHEKTKASSLQRTTPSMLSEKPKASPMQRSVSSRRVIPEKVRSSPVLVVRRSSTPTRLIPERTRTSPLSSVSRHDVSTRLTPEKAKSSPLRDDNPQTTGRGLASKNDDDVSEDFMLNHDVFLSTLRSRLTKLQVVRHFWGRNDMKGAIDALRKLPDHAVQADVISVLMEHMESLTLDLFSCLLPVLLGLMDSATERHINVSLEMLLKLVAVFGPVVNSTISAPQAVGVDLHAEKRLECCNQCHIELQKIHKSLPTIIRRGGLLARCAQELYLVLQQS